MKRRSWYEAHCSYLFLFFLLILLCSSLLAYPEDSEYVENRAEGGGRDYIVRNPRALLPAPSIMPLVKMDWTQEECEVWSEDKRVGNWIYPAYAPRVAVSGDMIHVIWKQRFYSKFTHHEVCYVRSTDGGVSWSDSVLLSVTDGVESIRPDVAVEDNNVYVVWEDWSSMSWGGIYFRKSTDGGTTWQDIIPVALRGVDDYDYYCPTIAQRDSEIYVAYNTNDASEESSLRFKRSVDYGETWETEVLVSENPEEGHWLKLVLNNQGLHISHGFGLRIYYNRSTDWGDSWSEDVLISDMDSSAAQWPSIGTDANGGVYVTWFDYKHSPYPWTGDIFLRRSTDNGQTWDSIMVLTDNHFCVESDVCADKSSAHVVWHDERQGDGNIEIYHRRSTDSGFSWEQEDRLTEALYASVDPSITTDKAKLYMTWVDDRDYPLDGRIFFKNGYWYLRGDVNRDRLVDIADIMCLINYLFIGGASPDIFESGDVNGDEQIDTGDVVYLINYLFIGGSPPVGC